jgi:hypothetical protein
VSLMRVPTAADAKLGRGFYHKCRQLGLEIHPARPSCARLGARYGEEETQEAPLSKF